MTTPEKIYLQLQEEQEGEDVAFESLGECTWCADRIFDSDVEYVRADSITYLLDQVWGNVAIRHGELICSNCGEISKAPRRPMSLANHLHTIFGFVNTHLKCKKQ